MSGKMKKSGLVIVASMAALILISVLAACPADLDIAAPGTGVDTGGLTGGYPGSSGPRIEIYDVTLDSSNNFVERRVDGGKISWLHDPASPVETARKITGRVVNGPEGSTHLNWQILQPESVTGGHVRFTSGVVNLHGVLPHKVHPHGLSFEAHAGTKPGIARLAVTNTTEEGRQGTLYAYVDLVISGQLPPLQVFVTETRTVSGISIKTNHSQIANAPQWSVHGGSAGISANNGGYVGGANSGYNGVSLTLTGLREGSTTYIGRAMVDGEWVDTEGPLMVDASTTWYVEQGANGTHGFRPTDKVTLNQAQKKMSDYYKSGYGWLWPGKGQGAAIERHAVLRFTGPEAGSIGFAGTDFPLNIDLVNDSPTGQKILNGVINPGYGKTLTLSGIKVTGAVSVGDNVKVSMLTPYTELAGNVGVNAGGVFTMVDGVISSTYTHVQKGGTLTVHSGSVNGNVDVYGEFIMHGGTFNSPRTHVMSGGTLTIKRGTHVSGGAQIHVNGAPHSSQPPTSSTLTTDFILAVP